MHVNEIAIGDELVYRSAWYPYELGPRVRVTEVVPAGAEENTEGILLLNDAPQYVRKSRVIGTVLDAMASPYNVGGSFLGLAESFVRAPEARGEA